MRQPSHDVCPPRLAGLLAIGLRKLVQDPLKIAQGLVHEGDTVADLGCGPGFFTSGLAQAVGDKGTVIAVDLQPEMLDKARRRMRKQGWERRVRFHRCGEEQLGLEGPVDAALAFYMVHEVPNRERFLGQVAELLRPGGKLLIVEPKMHVSGEEFERTLAVAQAVGLLETEQPRVAFSHSALLVKP